MIDNNTIEQVRNVDIIAFFEKYHGFTFTHRSGEYRCQQHKSLAVKADRRSFYWHSKGVGGFGVLDYLIKIENMPFREAVGVVVGTTPIPASTRQEVLPPKTLVLPEKAGFPLRLYDYLCKRRGIDSNIVNTLIQKEMLYEDRRGNVVFVGYDEHNKPRFATLRGTHDCQYRGDCSGSDKRYGFAVAACVPSERLYLYESAIDLMSHASLVNADTGDTVAWKHHNRLSLAGTSETAIPFFLNQHKTVKELVFCLDNDSAGREATEIMVRKYTAKSYTVLVEFPRGKDFNVDLQAHKTQKQAEKGTKNMERKGIRLYENY